jgi:alkylation response protein AidB-like acyl-CoA dehydrogenase
VTTVDHLRDTHPVFAREARTFDKFVAMLASESERSLRRHGKDIIKNQFVVRRIADIAIDLYAIACTLSRGTHLVAEKGEKEAAWEIQTARAFCRKARRRLAENFRRMDRNDDEWEASIAQGLYQRGMPTHGLFD